MSSIAQVLRLLGDDTRLRILILVSQTPLNVSELTTILGMAQSGISRHLSHLRKMKLLQERKEGIWTYYQLAQKESLESELHLLWNYLQEQLSNMKDPNNDRVRLHEVLRQRGISGGGLNEKLLEPGQSWFAWSCLLGILLGQNDERKSGFDSGTSELEIIDLGCGDGTLTVEMAKFAKQVVGVDFNPDILASARQRIDRLGLQNVRLLSEDVSNLSLVSESMDVVFFSQSLHHLDDPQRGFQEAARILRPGGLVLVMELAAHTEDWVLEKLGHKWLGFEKKTLLDYMETAKFNNLHSEKLPLRREELFQIILSAGRKT
ncbi:MAG: metalloregulator ArsR/SmtB family transcription factor [SAR324 cluster bacterium]|nr:metalloregulator ArsR/SmtB family transcription factor [SAR324 cluster bacterium]MBL7034171.1 metalloregulator ArsR/SmtB family transcription factor [SAR324 cluster bacterium]